MAGSNSHITILTLNVNGLNAPIKRQSLGNWIKSQNPSVCCIQETHQQGYTKAQNKGMKEDLPSKWRGKKARVAILISDKIDFKATKIKRDKERHYIMVND